MLDEEYAANIKEDRLSRMLAGEVVESEYRWIIYDDELTEVQIELSEIIFDKLIKEVIEEFNNI